MSASQQKQKRSTRAKIGGHLCSCREKRSFLWHTHHSFCNFSNRTWLATLLIGALLLCTSSCNGLLQELEPNSPPKMIPEQEISPPPHTKQENTRKLPAWLLLRKGKKSPFWHLMYCDAHWLASVSTYLSVSMELFWIVLLLIHTCRNSYSSVSYLRRY